MQLFPGDLVKPITKLHLRRDKNIPSWGMSSPGYVSSADIGVVITNDSVDNTRGAYPSTLQVLVYMRGCVGWIAVGMLSKVE